MKNKAKIKQKRNNLKYKQEENLRSKLDQKD